MNLLMDSTNTYGQVLTNQSHPKTRHSGSHDFKPVTLSEM